MDVDKSLDVIRKIDDIYRTSPTVQALTANAPAILSLFGEMRQHRMELERFVAERQHNLARFREIAPALSRELSLIGKEIRELHKSVRETAKTMGSNPNALTVIEFTNKQIADNINLFNNLSLNLLMS